MEKKEGSLQDRPQTEESTNKIVRDPAAIEEVRMHEIHEPAVKEQTDAEKTKGTDETIGVP